MVVIATKVAQISSALILFSVLAIQPAAAQWAPPIGIPAPSFGITNVAPAVPNPWTASTPGFYYVEPTKTASTDASNTYGTPAKPRKTIPTTLPAGSVVELHGTYDASHSSPATIVSNGTASAPVFIRGVSATSRPVAHRSWEIRGSYLVVENIEFGPMADQSDTGSMVVLLPSDHVSVRHNDVHGLPVQGGGIGVVNWEVPYGVVYTGPGYLDNIVLWDNLVHDNGDLNATFDQDVHGISVTDHVRYLWVVDNQIYRNSGDGIQINAQDTMVASTHHIYVGRNVSHHNKQSGFWVKSASDVIFSQNESYGHRPSNSSLGQGMGGQYGPDWVWFLYNHIHDCEYGITQMSDNQEHSRWFLIGNIIENIHHSRASDPSDSWAPSAIMMSGGYERHIINNTIYNTDSGVNISTPVGTLEIADGTQSRTIPLSPADLAQGKFAYKRATGDIQVRMSVEAPNGTKLQEASRFLGPPPSKKNDDELKALEKRRDELDAEVNRLKQSNDQQAQRIQQLERTLKILQTRPGN